MTPTDPIETLLARALCEAMFWPMDHCETIASIVTATPSGKAILDRLTRAEAAVPENPYTAFRNCFWCERHDYEIHADDCRWLAARGGASVHSDGADE